MLLAPNYGFREIIMVTTCSNIYIYNNTDIIYLNFTGVQESWLAGTVLARGSLCPLVPPRPEGQFSNRSGILRVCVTLESFEVQESNGPKRPDSQLA